MSKNLTKTNNTIKKVIARLCRCFAIFAVFLFAGILVSAQDVSAGGCGSKGTTYSSSSGGTWSSNTFTITNEGYAYVIIKNVATEGWFGTSFELWDAKIFVGGTQVKFLAYDDTYCNGSTTIYFSSSYTKIESSSTVESVGKGNGPSSAWIKIPFSSISNGTQIKVSTGDSWALDTSSITFTVKDGDAPNTPTLTNASGGNWKNEGFTVKASGSTDAYTGFSKYQYSYDNSNWQDWDSTTTKSGNTYTDTWSAPRDKTLYVRALDAAGNASPSASTPIRIDKSAPKISSISDPSDGTYASKIFYGKKGASITFTFADTGDPKSLAGNSITVKYRWSNNSSCSDGTDKTEKTNSYKATITFPYEEKTKYLCLLKSNLKDPAGNEATEGTGKANTTSGSYFVYQVIISNATPAFTMTVDGSLLAGKGSEENGGKDIYTHSASTNDEIILTLSAGSASLTAITETACDSITVTSSAGSTIGSDRISRFSDTVCKIKITSGAEATITITVPKDKFSTQAGQKNQAQTFKVIIDKTAPTVSVTAKDEKNMVCDSIDTFCYNPTISLAVNDTNAQSSVTGLTVKLLNSKDKVMETVNNVELSKTASGVFPTSLFADSPGKYDLTVDYYIQVKNFTDKAGNRFCGNNVGMDKLCDAAEHLYITNTAPKIKITYGGAGSDTVESGGIEIQDILKVPKNATNITFADQTGFGAISIDAKIHFLRGSKTSITNKNEQYNSNVATISNARSDTGALEFNKLTSPTSGFSIGVELHVYGAWRNNTSTTLHEGLKTTIFLWYDNYAPKFKSNIVSANYEVKTSSNRPGDPSGYDIYLDFDEDGNPDSLLDAFVDAGYGFNTSSYNGSSTIPTWMGFESFKVDELTEYTYSIDSKTATSSTYVIKHVNSASVEGSVTVKVTNAESGVSTSCVVKYDTRQVDFTIVAINKTNAENIYKESASGVDNYYFVSKGEFRITITNNGTGAIKAPELTGSGVTKKTCSSALATGASCTLDLDANYVGKELTISAKNDYDLEGTKRIKFIKIIYSMDNYISNTSTKMPTFTVGESTLVNSYISAAGSSSKGELIYTMYLDYASYFSKAGTSNIVARITSPTSAGWNTMNTSAHLSSQAVIGSTITGAYYMEEITMIHKLPDSKMLGCIKQADESVVCDSNGEFKYTLHIYYLKNNLEYVGPTSISVKNVNTTYNNYDFKYMNGDCNDENLFCNALKNGLRATNVETSAIGLSIVDDTNPITISKGTGFVEGKHKVSLTIPLTTYKIQTTAARQNIVLEQEIFFYESDMVFRPKVYNTSTLTWYDMIENGSEVYYSAITAANPSIYFDVLVNLPEITGVSNLPGKEVTINIDGNTYTSASAFGVESTKKTYIYLRFNSDMIEDIEDGSTITITIPADTIKLSNQGYSIQNGSDITFSFVNDTSVAELPFTVADTYNIDDLRVTLEHKSSVTGSDWTDLPLGGNEIYAVTFGDELKLTIAIKEKSPLMILSGMVSHDVCSSPRIDLTSDMIQLGNKGFGSCTSSVSGDYIILVLEYKVTKTWAKEVKDISISGSIYDSAFNQVPYRSIGLEAVVKVLPNAEVSSIVGFLKATEYKDTTTINYLNYNNTLVFKMVASDKTQFDYSKLVFDGTLTSYTIRFTLGGVTKLTLSSGVTFESDSSQNRVLMAFSSSKTTNTDFDAVSMEIRNFFYDGAKMSTSISNVPFAITQRFVTKDIISLEGIAPSLETLYMKETDKETYAYINTYTGFNKNDTYLYYTDAGSNKVPLGDVCNVTLNKTYNNDISYRISGCSNNIVLDGIGIHVKDKIDYEKDIGLNLKIVVDNIAPTIGAYTLSKTDDAALYDDEILYYVIQSGGNYEVYYKFVIADAGAGFTIGGACEVTYPYSARFLAGQEPTCTIVNATTAKVKLVLDTTVSAKLLANDLSFTIKITDNAGNSANTTVDAKISAVYDTSLADKEITYRVLPSSTTCEINESNTYCKSGKKIAVRAYFEDIEYSRYLDASSKFILKYDYKKSNGDIDTETIMSSVVTVDADFYMNFTFTIPATVAAPYALGIMDSQLTSIAGGDISAFYTNESGGNIYLYGDTSQLVNSSSIYYAFIADNAICTVQDANCEIASQIFSTAMIETLNEYGYEYTSVFNAATNTVGEHNFNVVISHKYISDLASATGTIKVTVSKRTIYLEMSKSSMNSDYSEDFAGRVDRAFERIGGQQNEIDLADIEGKYVFAIKANNNTITSANVKNANAGIYDLIVSPATGVTEYQFAISGDRAYTVNIKVLNINLATVQDKVKIYKDSNKSQLLGSGTYLTRAYGEDLLGEKVYITWEDGLANGEDVNLVANTLVFKGGTPNIGTGVAVNVSAFSTESSNYMVGSMPTYEAAIGKITAKSIELTLSSNIRKVKDGTDVVTYKDVDSSLEVKVSYGSTTLKVTLPAANLVKYESVDVGIVRILPRDGSTPITTLFKLNNSNYTISKIFGEITYDDNVPEITYVVNNHSTFDNEIYYASNDVIISAIVTDESGLDFINVGEFDIYTLDGNGNKKFKNATVVDKGNNRYELTYTATASDTYYIYAKDTMNSTEKPIPIDINKTAIALGNSNIALVRPEVGTVVMNGSGFELTIAANTLVKEIKTDGIVLNIKPKDSAGVIIDDSIIGDYACTFVNNFTNNTSVITCLGKFKNNSAGYPVYTDGVRFFVEKYQITNYYGITNFEPLSGQIDADLDVDFHTVGIHDLSSIELYNGATKLTSSTNIYGKFTKLVATFDLSMPLEDVTKPNSAIAVLNNNANVKPTVNNTCEITEDKLHIVCTVDNISFADGRIYNIRLSGEIKYNTNAMDYSANVETIADASKIFEEGIIVDTKELKTSLEFVDEFRLEGNTAKYELKCNKDAVYVDCVITDPSKVQVSAGSVTVIGTTIYWSGIKNSTRPTIKLLEGAVVDYAKNNSVASDTYTLVNTGISISAIEYTGTDGAVLTSTAKIGYGFTINVNVKLDKPVQLYGGIIYITYKFGTGDEITSEARFVTSASNSSVRYAIVIGEEDSGELTIVSIDNYDDGTVYDSTYFVAKALTWNVGSGLVIDTTLPDVSGDPQIKLDSSLEAFKYDDLYYLDKTNINKAGVTINFTEPLKFARVTIGVDNTGGDTIVREFNSISGTSVTIPFSNEYFSVDGRLQFSYTIYMIDEAGNVNTNENLIAIETNIVLDRTAPVIELENSTLNININNLTPNEGVYTAPGGTYTLSEENVKVGTNANANVVFAYATNSVAYKFTYGAKPIVKTITIPAGIYVDYAGNKSESVDVVLNITEDSYTLTPYIYINGTYKEAIYYIEEGAEDTFVYYIDKYTTFYFASNVELTSNTALFQHLNGYYTYTPEGVTPDANNRFNLTIPSNTFFAEGMANASKTIEYKVIDSQTLVELDVETSNDKTTLMVGDTIRFVITYTNPIIYSLVPSIRISIGGIEAVVATPNTPEDTTTLVYTYEYTIGKYDNGAVSFIGFASPASDVLYNTVNINSNNNLGIVVDNDNFAASLELLEEGRTDTQAKFKVVCNKEENVNCYITDPSKIQVPGGTVTIDETTHIVTISGLSDKKHEIIISSGAVIDNAGKESSPTTYVLDNTNIYISGVKINKANDNNEYNNKFSTNSNFIVRVTLSAGTKRLSVTGIPTITYMIGERTSTDVIGEASLNELIFNIYPLSDDEGTFKIINIKTNAFDLDAYNSATLLTNETDEAYIKEYRDILIDTVSPTLVSAKVIVNGVEANANTGKYYLSATTLSKATLEVAFSEALHANSVVEVYIKGYNSFVTSVANNVMGTKVVLSLNNIANLADGAFVIESISYSVLDLANNPTISSTSSIQYLNASNQPISIVYDNTAPEIVGISLIEGSKTTIKPGDKVVYELTTSDANLATEKSRFEYIYEYTGNYNPIIPAGHVIDYAGNPSKVTKFEHIMIYVRDDNPFVGITDITYINQDANKVYYFGEAKPNTITIVTGDEKVLTCTLTLDGCGSYISFDANNKLVINADAYTDEYGNGNEEVVTQYIFVNQSSEFTRSIFDDEFNETHNVLFNGHYLVSNLVSKTYELHFNTTREVKSVNYGELSYNSSGGYYVYKYRHDTFLTNTTVTITDYSDSAITLMSVVFDNDAPIVRFDLAEYTFNSTQDIVLGYNVNDEHAIRNTAILCGVNHGSCAGDNANMKIRVTKSAQPNAVYTLTIPEGYYVDLVGNKSAEVVVRINIVSGPIFIPYVKNPLTNTYGAPVSISDGNVLTYYVRALDTTNVKFVTPNAGNFTGDLAAGQIEGSDYLLYTGAWTVNNGVVVIPKDKVTVAGIKNIEQTFNFVVYDGPEGARITSNLTSMTETVYINTTHTIDIIYEFDRDIIIVNGAPKLNVKIGEQDVAFDDVTVSGRRITYKYRPTTGQNGPLTIVGFEPYGLGKATIYDNAYNVLNGNDIAYNTKYIVDTDHINEPTFTFSHNACIESTNVTNGDITYYCNSNVASTDKVVVTIGNLEAGITNNLIMKINGVEYEAFNNSGATEIPMYGRTGAQKILISGKLIDTSGNETSVSHTINNVVGIDGGYKVTMTVDPGNTIISQRTQMPKVTIKNNIGKYDSIMAELNNPNMFALKCGDVLCSQIAGLGDIVITTMKSGSQVVLSLDGGIQDNFVGPNVATFNFLTMESYYVISSNSFRFDNTTPAIDSTSITAGIEYNDRVYLIPKNADSILEFVVDFNIPLYENPTIYLGLDKANSIDVTSYATITESNGIYTISINNEGLTFVHSSNKFNKSDNEIVVSLGMTGENKVYAVETITAFSTFIDRSAPTVVFGTIQDNAQHKIPVSSEYVNIQEALSTDSGLANTVYQVCDKLDVTDCETIVPESGYLDINHLGDGDKVLVVTVTDNVGNTKNYPIDLFVDRTAPEIYLEKLHYTEETLTATIAVIDRNSDIDRELRWGYCVTNVTTDCTEALSYRLELNNSGYVDITYNLKLDQNINYRNFKITVLPIYDVIGNVSEEFVVTQVEHDNYFDGATDGQHNYLVATNVAKDYRDILVDGKNGVDSYDIVLDEHLVIMNVIDIPENVSVRFGENSNVLTIKVSKNVKLEDIMKMTINARYINPDDENSSKITLSYPITLTNLRVDNAPIVEEDIETRFAPPYEGEAYSVIDSSTIISEEYRNERITSITPNVTNCEASSMPSATCLITYVVVENSGWSYIVDKTIDISTAQNVVITGISNDKYAWRGNDYMVAYYDGNLPTIKFEHAEANDIEFVFISMTSSHGEITRNDTEFTLPLGRTAIVYGYYTETKIMLLVTYNFLVVDLSASDAVIDSDRYYNEHSIDLSKLFNDYETYEYVANYIVEIGSEVYSFTNRLRRTTDNIYFVDNKLVFDNIFNGLYDIKITGYLNDATNNNVVALELFNVKFDNGIYEGTEYMTTGFDSTSPEQSKSIVITLTCDRDIMAGCNYTTSNVDDGASITPEYSNGIYTFTFNEEENGTYNYEFFDDAGNSVVITRDVTNIDTYAPQSNGHEYTGCLYIGGYNYCNDPTLTIDAEDKQDPEKPNNTISGIVSYKFGHIMDGGPADSAEFSDPITIPTLKYEKLVVGHTYTILVRVTDAAGNYADYTIIENVRVANSTISFNMETINGSSKEFSKPITSSNIVGDEDTVIDIVSIEMFINDVSYGDINTFPSGKISYVAIGVEEDIANARIHFVVTDALGRTYTSEVFETNIDITKPTINIDDYSEALYYDERTNTYYVSSSVASAQEMSFMANENIKSSTITMTSSGDLVGKTVTLVSKVYGAGYSNAREESFALTKTINDITIVVTDIAGNVSDQYTIRIIVDKDNPYVNNHNTITNSVGGTIEYNEPFYTNYENVYDIITTTDTTTFIITSQHIVAKLSSILDDTSGMKKICLFSGDELTYAATMTCLNSNYQYMAPSGNTSTYLISNGSYVLYAIDNVGNTYSHKYVVNNVSGGIKFTVNRSGSEIIGANVTLTTVIDTSTVAGRYDIIWYQQKDGDFAEITAARGMTKHTVEDNGTYRVCIVSSYSVTNCTDDLGGDIVINTIDKSDIVKGTDKPVFDADRSTLTHNGYFGNASGNEKLVYLLPDITSTLSEISVSGTYVKNSNNISIPLPTTVIRADSVLPNDPNKYKYNSSIRTYEIDIASLGLVNGDTVSIQVVMNAANHEVGVYSAITTLTYITADNYTGVSVLLSESNEAQPVTLENGGYYKSIFAKLGAVDAIFDSVNITKVAITTFDNAVISPDTYVIIAKNGYYNSITVSITDEFGNEKVINNIAIASSFTIDNVSDDIHVGTNVSNPPTTNDNVAYIKYTPYKTNLGQFVRVELVDAYHSKFTIYADDTRALTLGTANAGGYVEIPYQAFYVDAVDYAGNVSKLSSEITHENFEDLPISSFAYNLHQDSDGKNASITLVYTTINVKNFSIVGYAVCEIIDSQPSCPQNIDGESVTEDTIELIRPDVIEDLSQFVGKYIKVYAKDYRGDEAVFYMYGELDLRSVTITAPYITQNTGIMSNGVAEDEIIYNNSQQIINIESNVRTVRYIVKDANARASNYPNINNSSIFNDAWSATSGISDFISRDVVDLSTYDSDKGLYSSSITINYMDGEYVFYLIAIESDGAGNVIYSTVKVLRLIVDTKAPKVLYSSVEIDENVVYNANVTGVPSITFTVSEERESATLFKYSIDGGSLSSKQDTNTNPYIEIKGDGEHTIMVCDLDIANNCLNSKTYNIKVDASSPDIELKYGDTAITTSSTIGYTILVANRTIPTFETDIVIEDTSFDYVDITVDAGSVGYKFRYNTTKGYLYRSGSREIPISIPVIDGYANIVTIEGKLMSYSLHSVAADAEYVTIEGIEYIINRSSEQITSIVPKTIYENSICTIPLRVIVAMALANNEFLVDVPYITGIKLQAYDGMSQVNNSLTELTKEFDFFNPVISTVNDDKLFTITDTNIRQYLSDSSYRYIFTRSTEEMSLGDATSMMSVCTTNASNYSTICTGAENVLHLQATTTAKDSSKALLAVLKHLLRFDGVEYDKLTNKTKVFLYYTGSMNEGQPHTEGLIDDSENYVLTQLTVAGKYNFYVQYTDENNNTSYYYLPIIVEDTIAPTFSLGTSSVNKSVDINVQADGEEYAVYNLNTLTYDDNYYGTAGVTCTFVLTYASSPSHVFAPQSCEENMQFTHDGHVYANYDAASRKISLNYSGTYTMVYTLEDGGYYRNGMKQVNTATKSYTFTVIDKTPAKITELTVLSKYSVNDNVIDLGTMEYKDIKVSGISLYNAIKTLKVNEPNQINGSYDKNAFQYVASGSTLGSSRLESNEENRLATALTDGSDFRPQALGKYTLVYEVTNSNNLSTKIKFKVNVVNTELPKFTLTDNYLKPTEQVKDFLQGTKYESSIEITAHNALLFTQLAEHRLSYISILVTDEFSGILHEGLISDSASKTCTSSEAGNSNGSYAGYYKCTFKYKGTASEGLSLEVYVYLKDTIAPTIATNNQTIYTKTDSLTVTLPGCADNADSLYANVSTCKIKYSTNGSSNFKDYGSKITLALSDGDNILEFYAIDRAGNISTRYKYTYKLDRNAPVIDLYASSEHKPTDYEYEVWCTDAAATDCIANSSNDSYTLNDSIKFVHYIIEEENKETVALERFNGTSYELLDPNVVSDYIDENGNIIATGLYRLTVNDKANNIAEREFYVYKETKNESGNLTINVSQNVGGTTTTTNIEYRQLFLIKYDDDRLAIPYSGNESAFDSIKMSDGVHIVGLSDNVFTYIRKYNGSDVHNLSTSIRLNDPAALQNMIEINGETYLILLLVDNDDGNGNVTDPDGDGSGNGSSNSGASFAWVFYVLGAVGVVGGGFLVMKLRKKVKAA